MVLGWVWAVWRWLFWVSRVKMFSRTQVEGGATERHPARSEKQLLFVRPLLFALSRLLIDGGCLLEQLVNRRRGKTRPGLTQP
jgi:hypothetical protein